MQKLDGNYLVGVKLPGLKKPEFFAFKTKWAATQFAKDVSRKWPTAETIQSVEKVKA